MAEYKWKDINKKDIIIETKTETTELRLDDLIQALNDNQLYKQIQDIKAQLKL